MEIAIDQNIKTIPTKHQISSSKQNFESDDSQGSDLSYESSLTDEEDSNIGRVQFFKQEMARFFINYPELINQNIIKGQDNSNDSAEDSNGVNGVNKNWEIIAEEILHEAKESSTSLDSLAKRISLYRYKIDQSDIIDILLQQKNTILKEIEAEIAQKNSQTNLIGHDKSDKIIQNNKKEDNVYYSWVNQKIFKSKYLDKNQGKKSIESLHEKKSPYGYQRSLERPKIIQRQTKSTHKGTSVEGRFQRANTFAKRKQVNQANQSKKSQMTHSNMNMSQLSSTKQMNESQVTLQKQFKQSANWKHLLNFQPKTQICKQLCEQIKKNHYSDDLSIKKTIISFLSRYKEMINNEIINKVTLSQKIQKQYNDDAKEAKELLMFYPSKTSNFESSAPSNNNLKDNSQDKFIKLLKEINDGPLMKYWRQSQQNKI